MTTDLTRDDRALELSRVCRFARVSLNRRFRNRLAEDNVDSPRAGRTGHRNRVFVPSYSWGGE